MPEPTEQTATCVDVGARPTRARQLTFTMSGFDGDVALAGYRSLQAAQARLDQAVAEWNRDAGTTWEPSGNPTPAVEAARKARDWELDLLGRTLLGSTGVTLDEVTR